MCFHLGFVHAYIWDYGTDKERWAKPRETEQIIDEIYQKFVENNGAIQYIHKVSPDSICFFISLLNPFDMWNLCTWGYLVHKQVFLLDGNRWSQQKGIPSFIFVSRPFFFTENLPFLPERKNQPPEKNRTKNNT